jgi:hypothetical protein
MEMQKAFRYFDPVAVGYETVKGMIRSQRISQADADSLNASKWWKAWKTTRTLLAHAAMVNSERLMKISIGNLRCIMRLFGVDIATKDAFQDYDVVENCRFHSNAPGVKWYIDMTKSEDDILGMLNENMSYDALAQDFTLSSSTTRDIVMLVGHAVYQLVATRDGKWKEAAALYADFPSLLEPLPVVTQH